MQSIDHAMVQEIKAQVIEELDRGRTFPTSTPGREYQDHRQLVDAVREEVLYELRSRSGDGNFYSVDQRLVAVIKQDVLRELEGRRYGGGTGTLRTYGYNRFSRRALSPAEMEMIKQDVLRDLQGQAEEQEGHGQG